MSKHKKICCIYMLKNNLNGNVYIRQTMELLDYLDNSSVETIENDYKVKYLTY